MIFAIGSLAFIVAGLGIYLGQLPLVLASALIAIWFAWRFGHDLQLVAAYFGQRERSGFKNQRGDRSPTPLTTSGQSILRTFGVLERKVADLSWEVNSARDLHSTETDLVADQSGYLHGVFSMIASRFRARSAAILLWRGGSLEFQSYGLSGPRFEQALKRMFSGYLEEGRAIQFGTQNIVDELSPLSIFGVGSSLTYSIAVPDGRGVIWLGYDRGTVPSTSESRALASLAQGLHRDIVTRRKIEEMTAEVKRVEGEARAQSELIAGMSHDIRAPLHNLKNILALFKFESSAAESQSLVTSALENCDQLVDLVEDLLLLSRHQLGRLVSQPREVDLGDELARLVGSYRASASVKGLTLELRDQRVVGERGVTLGVQVDLRQLRRMVINLLSNAVKYTQAGGVVVELREPAIGQLAIAVIDSGVGLSEQQLGQLFVPFTRFDPSSSEGVGLGLAITKILVELNGGVITARSNLGQGSEFEIAFPAIELSESAIAATKTRDYHDRSLDGVSERALGAEAVDSRRVDSRKVINGDSYPAVLLVDDDYDGASSLGRLLEQYGLRVLQASGVNEALGIVQLERPGVIVTDLGMPAGGAERLIREIRSRDFDLPILILSGDDELAKQRAMFDLGIETFMTKPVCVDTLVDKIREYLAIESDYEDARVVAA